MAGRKWRITGVADQPVPAQRSSLTRTIVTQNHVVCLHPVWGSCNAIEDHKLTISFCSKHILNAQVAIRSACCTPEKPLPRRQRNDSLTIAQAASGSTVPNVTKSRRNICCRSQTRWYGSESAPWNGAGRVSRF